MGRVYVQEGQIARVVVVVYIRDALMEQFQVEFLSVQFVMERDG